MDYTYSNLQKKVDKYSKGVISKNELCIWSKEAYFDFLLEGFFYIEKIYAYPFVKKFSAINVIPDDKNDVFPYNINIITVLDILEFKILNILRELTDEEQGIIYCGHINDLYYNKENQYGTNNLIDILIKYIDCFMGKNGTIIEASYYKGKPNINVYPDNNNNI